MAIGTAALIALGLGTAGAQTAASIYSSRSANKTNERALAAGERDAERAEQLERERLAEERAARQELLQLEQARDAERALRRDQLMAMDQQRWQDYLRVHEPHWAMGAGVLGNLYDMAGISRGSMQSAPPPQAGPAGAPMLARSTTGGDPRLSLYDMAQRTQGLPGYQEIQQRSPLNALPGRQAPQGMSSALPTPQGMGLQSLLDLARMSAMFGGGGGGMPSRTGAFLPYLPGAI